MTKATYDKIAEGLNEVVEMTRRGTHPGVVLREEFMRPMGLTPAALADEIGSSRGRVMDLIREAIPCTPIMAVKLAKRFNTSPFFWMNLQRGYDA